MKYAAELWGTVLAGGLVIALPIFVPWLIWGDAGAIAGGIFWAVVFVVALTIYYVTAMKELDD